MLRYRTLVASGGQRPSLVEVRLGSDVNPTADRDSVIQRLAHRQQSGRLLTRDSVCGALGRLARSVGWLPACSVCLLKSEELYSLGVSGLEVHL